MRSGVEVAIAACYSHDARRAVTPAPRSKSSCSKGFVCGITNTHPLCIVGTSQDSKLPRSAIQTPGVVQLKYVAQTRTCSVVEELDTKMNKVQCAVLRIVEGRYLNVGECVSMGILPRDFYTVDAQLCLRRWAPSCS